MSKSSNSSQKSSNEFEYGEVGEMLLCYKDVNELMLI